MNDSSLNNESGQSSQPGISKFCVPKSQPLSSGDLPTAPIYGWSINLGGGSESQNINPMEAFSKITPCECPNFGAKTTKSDDKVTPVKSVKAAGSKKEGNLLAKMQRFYQGFFMKTSKTLHKGKNSKKQILEAMCERLRKSTLLSEVETDDLVLHLGSIIYPSKSFLKHKSSFQALKNVDKVTGELRAKKAIYDFHSTLLQFSERKLEKLLAQETFNKLYNVFWDSMASAKAAQAKPKVEAEVKTVKTLTNQISTL